jgi:hypothetical protein
LGKGKGANRREGHTTAWPEGREKDMQETEVRENAARTSETLVNFYQTTQRYNPEDSHLQN